MGCIDPLVSDQIDLARVFGDPAIPPEAAPHVEDNPELADKTDAFPGSPAYLRGFASGRAVWYWRIAGPAQDFIIPFYVVVESDGTEHPPIIDAIPGEAGYSQWWRRVIVRTTSKYAGERIWSRAAVDAGVQLGILDPPEATARVVSCPVVKRDARLIVDARGTSVEPAWAFYRNQRVSWFALTSEIDVPVATRRMPKAAMYVFQRSNQSTPLFELATSIDLDGDGKFVSSNNVFQNDIGEPGYTPLWYRVLVRTVPEYVSIDTATASKAIGLTNAREFLGADQATVISPSIVPPLLPELDHLDACPIQKTPGTF